MLWRHSKPLNFDKPNGNDGIPINLNEYTMADCKVSRLIFLFRIR